MACITLLTDFGTRDHYVGAMKGVIAALAPNVPVIDITHEVPPFRVEEGAYLLSQAWPWFPRGTVHLAVVDPGVGTARRAIAIEFEGHFFVGPDNGLLPAGATRQIANPKLQLEHVSATFHGRDIFAPAAAHLAGGFPFVDVGSVVNDPVRLPEQSPAVLHIDRFGNVVTNLREPRPLHIGTAHIERIARTYGDAPEGELFLIVGSGGLVEVSMRSGSAAAALRCSVGDPIEKS